MIAVPSARERWTPGSDEERAAVLSELEQVLASPQFVNSKRYPAFLRYVVEQTLLGHGDELKERTVGVEVFGRRPDYDTNLDTVVRYSAGEVRKRLALHYQEIPDTPVQIRLISRSYKAEFLRITEAPAPLPLEDPEPVLPERMAEQEAIRPGRRRFLLGAAGALAVAGTGAGWYWWHSREDSLTRFWKPLLTPKAPVLLGVGGVTFTPNTHSGTEPAADGLPVNPYLSFENGLAMGRVASIVNAQGGEYRIQASANLTLAQIRENPTVLIGAYNNEWARRMVNSLRFHFLAHPDEKIVDAQDPNRLWARDSTSSFGNEPDYALVARFRNPSTRSMVVVLAGLQRFGTDAASQFVTSPTLMDDFSRQAGAGWESKNLEVILKVEVINGRAGAPTIEAIHLW